ncbi:ImmA/IrrE family metallo-endopeptidase [Aestuariivirga sp. YIM B02566]|uniref:ImmA/IrrE family metallo-endopeptidase n=1 Tax=Taklimakanibacter albus TaxID=2800327 RepID=A0ACC5RDB7_9HYPH|nr:ImmA/IrrE family metallo-endopeptidase [Aestuariivirga sp. YIM B02566]MBK1870622.1 ImmA/IrrE family metallo-endopeptidase [Aestuariivirga sp. YIM B02566]
MKNRPSAEWLALPESQIALIAEHQGIAPVPVGAIAKSLGLAVKVATLPVDISGEIKPDTHASAGFQIRVNKHEAKTRQRFTIAHEIAHFLLHKHLIKDGLTDSILYRSKLTNKREAEANRLAADILMPWSLVDSWRTGLKGVDIRSLAPQLASYLEVSEVALKIRLGINGVEE